VPSADAVTSASPEARPDDPDALEPGAVEGRPGRRFVIWLLVLVGVGVAIRFPYLWWDRRHVEFLGDSYYYHQGANLLADGQGFINPFTRNFYGETLEAADHPPAYLVYLALFSAVGLTSVTAHMFASALLGLSSIVLAGFVGRRVAGDRVGLIAAALVAVAPNVWRYDGAMLSEVMVIPLVLLAVLLGYRYWDRPSLWRLLWLGAVIGLGGLTRPELLLLVPMLVLPLALFTRRVSARTRWAWAVGASVVAGLVVTPWIAFNATRFEEPVLFTQNLGQTLAGANCDSTYYGELVGYWDFACPVAVLAENGISRSTLDSERSERLVREAGIDYMRDHPRRVPLVVGARVGRIVGVYRPTQQRDLDALTEGVTMWVATFGMITVPVTIAGAVAGGVVLRRRGRLSMPLVMPVASVLVTVVVFYAASRFRATAEGPMLVLCAVALDAAWRWWRSRPGRAGPERVDDDVPVPA
jgi:4-amino-4-deoxy-L-arabinose transferase-like glycosyltransferase